MLKLLDILGIVAAFVLLVSAIKMLRRCRRAELSAESLLAIGIALVAILSIGKAVSPRDLAPEHVLALVVGAGWAMRALKSKKRNGGKA